MPRHHGTHGYGATARILHWLVALLLAGVALRGLSMVSLPAGTEAEVAAVLAAYSTHKTLGVAAFAIILLRLLWVTLSTAPGPLHPERPLETFLGRTTHLVLWGAMLALPLSGLVRHSAAPGFAPILWPMGQALPGVPADEGLSLVARNIHAWSAATLGLAVLLHLAGVLKHVVLDADATLARMTTGRGPYAAPARGRLWPSAFALLIWSGVIAGAVATAPAPELDPFFDDASEFVPADTGSAPAPVEPDGPATPAPQPTETETETVDEPTPPAD